MEFTYLLLGIIIILLLGIFETIWQIYNRLRYENEKKTLDTDQMREWREVFRKGFNRLSLMNKWILGITFISIPAYIAWNYYTTSEIFWPGVGIFAVLLFLILLPVLTSGLFKKVMAWLIVTLIFLYLALMFYDQYQVRQAENDQNSNVDEITDSSN